MYRFLGTEAEIFGYPTLRRFGQRIELPEEVAREAIKGGCALIPEADFWAIGFTNDELTDYATPGQRISATAEFAEKWRMARMRLHEIREGMEVMNA